FLKYMSFKGHVLCSPDAVIFVEIHFKFLPVWSFNLFRLRLPFVAQGRNEKLDMTGVNICFQSLLPTHVLMFHYIWNIHNVAKCPFFTYSSISSTGCMIKLSEPSCTNPTAVWALIYLSQDVLQPLAKSASNRIGAFSSP